MNASQVTRGITFALLAAMLLRAAIPDGYMPASAGSGLLFELCPSGLPDGFVASLSGQDKHVHHAEDQRSGEHFSLENCPVGQLLAAVVAVDLHWLGSEPPQAESPVFLPAVLRPSDRVSLQQARGPPA